ncbi:hypothetical protein SAMN04490248_11237 [Salinihabitans flavidus]|uniref:Uncharacterized protein n=1 Tax=Salinihabitans flavidus TaxID=569882 RepID=A0A1H8SHX4_9RHOB|nr:hypothetical protein SAMN04490248_11237 [Salinihabitans flavidus]
MKESHERGIRGAENVAPGTAKGSHLAQTLENKGLGAITYYFEQCC